MDRPDSSGWYRKPLDGIRTALDSRPIWTALDGIRMVSGRYPDGIWMALDGIRMAPDGSRRLRTVPDGN